MKNTQSKTKPIKTGKELGTTNCLGSKEFTHIFRLQEVKVTNKVLRETSNCTDCQSNNSRFLKQKHKKIIIIQLFTNWCYKKMKTYCVKCRKNTKNSNSNIF